MQSLQRKITVHVEIEKNHIVSRIIAIYNPSEGVVLWYQFTCFFVSK